MRSIALFNVTTFRLSTNMFLRDNLYYIRLVLNYILDSFYKLVKIISRFGI